MQAVKILCPHCSRTITVDAAKLPAKKVSFGCPGCKGKVVVDPATLGAQQPQADAAQTSAPPAKTKGGVDNAVLEFDIELPPGATIPPGAVIGDNQAVIANLKSVLEPFSCELDQCDSPEDIRARVHEEVPPLIFYCPKKAIEKPPLKILSPITTMAPADRRRTFIILVAENVKTIDGRAAFLYMVNLTMASADAGNAAKIVYSALDYHNRLYRPLITALEARHS